MRSLIDKSSVSFSLTSLLLASIFSVMAALLLCMALYRSMPLEADTLS